MRIVIVAPPKAGNSWMKCLLSAIYDLEWLKGHETPDKATIAAFQEWIAAGGFPDGTIYHQHYDYSPELVAAIAAVPAQIVSIIRDPYDAFVSQYFFVQAQAENPRRAEGRGRGRRADLMVGRAIDDPEVLGFLESGFQSYFDRAAEWLNAGVPLVRYEALHADPLTALMRVTEVIAPVDRLRVETAIDMCGAQNMLRSRPGLGKRIRTATVGDWRNHLTEAHLAIFRTQYAESIQRLGYEVQ
jgi:hypothetical protein